MGRNNQNLNFENANKISLARYTLKGYRESDRLRQENCLTAKIVSNDLTRQQCLQDLQEMLSHPMLSKFDEKLKNCIEREISYLSNLKDRYNGLSNTKYRVEKWKRALACAQRSGFVKELTPSKKRFVKKPKAELASFLTNPALLPKKPPTKVQKEE